ncbi:MAG: hypothetical protein NT023_19235 [Armatimonadetes bacterium]|nr:hypothetical protein [Armatimonadota bacterium]
MSNLPTYQTSIPETATPKVIEGVPNFVSGQTEYYIEDRLVGTRCFDEDGSCDMEISYRNGVMHGWYYTFHTPTQLMSAEPWESGLVHGTAYQWDRQGNLIGQYTMEHGTGLDLWWHENFETEGHHLSEAYHYQNGLRHGYEWSFSEGGLHREVPWFEGKQHGVERHWNFNGRLRRGYTQYWLGGVQVKRPEYLRAAKTDSTLPPFRAENNLPIRELPPEIQKHLPPRDA